jgi:leucyl-tRNA synthetase
MICVNELNSAKCNKKAILEELLSLLTPFAPHITEELWKLCGNTNSITDATFPVLNESYLVEDVYSYPVSFNGKMRFILELSLSLSKDEIEQAVMTCEQAQKWIDGKTPKKVIIVPNKIVNIVV